MDDHRTTDERVLSVRIETAERGGATLRVCFGRATAGPGRSDADHELQWRGNEQDLRDRARALAAVHDLVPVWEDRSWLAGATRRPPASLYRTRER